MISAAVVVGGWGNTAESRNPWLGSGVGIPGRRISMAQRIVKCVKLNKELPGLEEPPWTGELGQRIYDNVSQEAWNEWVNFLRMLINEYRLVPSNKESQEFIARQMEQFFFGAGSAPPPDYVPIK